MSYQLQAILVDAPSIAALYGSQELGLVDEILKVQGLDIVALSEYFEQGPRPRQCLEDILKGKLQEPNAKAQYALAYTWLCKQKGRCLNFDEWKELGIREIIDLDLDRSCFMPLPLPEDFPIITSLEPQELPKLRKHWEQSYMDEDAQKQALAWILAAEKLRKSLVLSCFFV